ncbi:hypothetical protein GN958_ATG13532 [Phytophthora infestans]|uniref:Uncharacterized protein n=1 Tax=Phytophthora infestans TaxID=4787 RepID=A0A8S9UDC2_PHYIN|nr:hypothetical protein GN958_ATG13532 [Phytophthora infestans]
MLKCLGPFSGFNGNAIADSEHSLATLCSAAVVEESIDGFHSDDANHESNEQLGSDTHPATAAQDQNKRPSVFSPAKNTLAKRSKKDQDLSTLAISVSSLVSHIAGKPATPGANELATARAKVVSVRQNIMEVGNREAELKTKLDEVAD